MSQPAFFDDLELIQLIHRLHESGRLPHMTGISSWRKGAVQPAFFATLTTLAQQADAAQRH